MENFYIDMKWDRSEKKLNINNKSGKGAKETRNKLKEFTPIMTFRLVWSSLVRFVNFIQTIFNQFNQDFRSAVVRVYLKKKKNKDSQEKSLKIVQNTMIFKII